MCCKKWGKMLRTTRGQLADFSRDTVDGDIAFEKLLQVVTA